MFHQCANSLNPETFEKKWTRTRPNKMLGLVRVHFFFKGLSADDTRRQRAFHQNDTKFYHIHQTHLLSGMTGPDLIAKVISRQKRDTSHC